MVQYSWTSDTSTQKLYNNGSQPIHTSIFFSKKLVLEPIEIIFYRQVIETRGGNQFSLVVVIRKPTLKIDFHGRS